MDYTKYLNGEDIPTIRRLDKIVKGKKSYDVGLLYKAFRNLKFLNYYINPNVKDTIKEKEFGFGKENTIPKLEWVNEWMKSHGLEEVFSNVNDWKAIGKDYDYYWNLRTKEQYDKEEAEKGKKNNDGCR